MIARSCTLAFALLVSLTAGTQACSSSDPSGSGGSSFGPSGCSRAPDCNYCQACFDKCLCAGGDGQACLGQCGAGGAGGGAGAPAGGSGGGTSQCTKLQTGIAACDQCLHTTCCSAIDACLNDATCSGLNDCINSKCASVSQAEFQSCVQSSCGSFLTQSTVNLYNGIQQCATGSCSGSC